MEEVPSNSVTLIVTSPPYWNVRDYGGEQIGFGQSYEKYLESLNQVWKECIRVLQPNGKIAINIQPLPISSEVSSFKRRFILNIMHDVEKFMRKNELFLSGMHYWDKSTYINNVSWGSYPKPTNIASNTSFEQIFVWVKRGKTRRIDKATMERNLLKKQEWRHWAVRCIWDDIAPVIKINSKKENIFGHSAPFPEEIPYRLIKMHTVEGETVLDPFLGSGTTLKIANLLGRTGIGYEINVAYKSLIKKRILEKWTPSSIESGYFTIGHETFSRMIHQTIKSVLEHEHVIDDTFNNVLKHVLKSLLRKKLLTPTLRKKVLNWQERDS
ncbi:MAG: DNA-methyltransferase [Promethearchaeota archaeon]